MQTISFLFRQFAGNRYALPLILVVQLGLHLLLYFNTLTFEGISESGALIGKLDDILSGDRPKPLYGFYWYFTPAYIAYFFISIFGTIDAYYFFQCLLATFTSLLVYIVTVRISGSRISGIVSLLLTTVYAEYLLLSSVFYNQVYENFFTVLFLLLVINIASSGTVWYTILNSLVLLVVVLLSLFFRNTFVAIFFYLLLAGIWFLARKQSKPGATFLLLSVVIFMTVFVIKPLDYFREGEYRPPAALEFWGHTTYGGNGGEVGFIYSENEELFNSQLVAYAEKKGISVITSEVVEEFKAAEVRLFVTTTPHKWLFLQVKKVFYTFGIMPQRDGLTMLMTGKVPLSLVPSIILLQIPFLLIIILFIMTVETNFRQVFGLPGKVFLTYLLGLYLISAISVYSAWAERYRIVAMIAVIIPVIGFNIGRLKALVSRGGRKELLIRLSFVFLMIIIWGYQAYEALTLHKERYLNAIERFTQ